jgi:hypothetical protein
MIRDQLFLATDSSALNESTREVPARQQALGGGSFTLDARRAWWPSS